MSTVNCSECDAELAVADDCVIGEIITCSECGGDLEVISTDPLTVELAPEVEEDWGE
ncbi:MAG TPA: hypothetical protein PKD64_07950 [Pirellulaceae bacterium]|nr:hypothetical protein [Pirellulaceae bacterium]HMO92120.1 hypothetical protein [Pirellulaceae bacterium]HMP69292.1 hypothetical protein [Pirellulaceae bacterium]